MSEQTDLTEIEADTSTEEIAASEEIAVDTEQVDGEILRTTGLSSVVKTSHTDSGDEEVLGHILMLEWDDVDNVFEPIRDLKRLPGISILLQSSAQSWHGYNLSVRPFCEQVTDAAKKSGDMGHVRASARRGYFVLRILEKTREETGEVYKPAPEVVDVFVSDSELPQSGPHLRFFESLCEEQGEEELRSDLIKARAGEPEVVEEPFLFIGSDMSVDHYQTATDELRGRGRGGEAE